MTRTFYRIYWTSLEDAPEQYAPNEVLKVRRRHHADIPASDAADEDKCHLRIKQLRDAGHSGVYAVYILK